MQGKYTELQIYIMHTVDRAESNREVPHTLETCHEGIDFNITEGIKT